MTTPLLLLLLSLWRNLGHNTGQPKLNSTVLRAAPFLYIQEPTDSALLVTALDWASGLPVYGDPVLLLVVRLVLGVLAGAIMHPLAVEQEAGKRWARESHKM